MGKGLGQAAVLTQPRVEAVRYTGTFDAFRR